MPVRRVAERPHPYGRGCRRAHPGQGAQRALGGVPVRARVQPDRPVGERAAQHAHRFRHLGAGQRGGLGEEVGQRAVRRVQRLAVRPYQLGGVFRRPAEDGPYGQFLGVGGARRPQAGAGRDQRAEQRVGAQPLGDGVRVGVQVEQAAHPLDGGGQVAQVGQVQPALQPAAVRTPGGRAHQSGARPARLPGACVLVDLGDAAAVGEPQRAAVRTGAPRAAHLLHARHRARLEEVEDLGGGVRAPVGQPQRDTGGRAVPRGAGRARTRPRAGSRRRAQLTRRTGVDLPHRVVELPDAGESGGEGHIGDRQAGGLEEQPRGVRAPGPRQGHGPGAQLGRELPLHLPRAVPQPPREAADALPVDHAVVDEPHGAADQVGPDVPLRRARHGVRTAAAAGPEPGALRGRGGRVEPYVRTLRGDRRATRAAVDPGGHDGEEELAVEPGVPARHRLVPGLVVHHTIQCARRAGDSLAGIGHRAGAGTGPRSGAGARRHPPCPYPRAPLFRSTMWRPRACFCFQSLRISARSRASVLATMRSFSRSSLR
ncbi:hypothetical protein SRIMHP_41165 (plasmid) [Streptomyces rimosus subsp. rimosus]|nr:hypothetical protein SRIMHP_41165 [Streptomyces rimosus subsp. rimosus]